MGCNPFGVNTLDRIVVGHSRSRGYFLASPATLWTALLAFFLTASASSTIFFLFTSISKLSVLEENEYQLRYHPAARKMTRTKPSKASKLRMIECLRRSKRAAQPPSVSITRRALHSLDRSS